MPISLESGPASIIKIHQQQHLLPKTKRQQTTMTTTTTSKNHQSDNLSSVSAVENTEKQVFVDFKGIQSPPPSQLGSRQKANTNKRGDATASKHHHQGNKSFRSSNPRFRNYDKVFRKENAFASSSYASNKFSEGKLQHAAQSNTTNNTSSTGDKQSLSSGKPAKKIIDLNQLNNDSKLASHYLAFHSASHLSELKLYDLWPSSKMYKVTIKTNPWVDSFKAKSYAHEVNDSFRHFNPNTKANLFPNIKQIY